MSRSMKIAQNDLKLEALYIVHPGNDRYPLDAQVEALPLVEATKLRL